jgi:hypothetical protein
MSGLAAATGTATVNATIADTHVIRIRILLASFRIVRSGS